MERKVKRYLITALTTAVVTLFGAVCGSQYINPGKAEAAAGQPKETVEIRIIGTTDLHGQVNNMNYEQGVTYNNGGLARVYDLIKKTRGELPKENSVTLDAGDSLFDYTTEFIFGEDQNALQPIYQAMAKIGYDAITLGNHDFDYGYDYILRQLNGTGLKDIAVVSNVTDSKTGDYPFLENKLITRTLRTSSGKQVKVNIGIIGQTIPTLTSKTQSYAGILKTEDMVENAKIQAAKLKEMGADIVIALSHTGIGPEKPELNFKNEAYALTKIPDIDVVVCGHEHNLFPTSDMTSPYYRLPYVDKKTFLMNGKNVIMAGDRGEAIGVVDLTLDVSKDSYKIVNRRSEIRKVTASNTTQDKSIASTFGDWEQKLLQFGNQVVGQLNKDEIIQDYFGMVGDNAGIQLLNDAKIDYAQRYVNTAGRNYKNYPIIAASTYAHYGSDSVDDYVNITDKITEAHLTELQPYNNYLYLYTITGKQLKEWLEWSASAYETVYFNKPWSDQTMNDLMKLTNLKPLLREDWQDNWSNFYIFDGIDYVIDPTSEPRYDISGNKIANSYRIKNVMYNGKEVTDDMTFLLATSKITAPSGANSGVEKQSVLGGFNKTQQIVGRYITRQSSAGSILPHIDDNWRVILPKDYQFIIKTPYYVNDLFKKSPWYRDYITEKDQYSYFKAAYRTEESDVEEPHIVATPMMTNPTSNPFDIAVNVSDASSIAQLKFLKGDYDVNYSGWSMAKTVDKVFTVYQNGLYTIYAEDACGNKSIKKLVIENFSDNLLGTPTVDKYTNRKTAITGLAEPDATIVFEAYTGTYEGKVSISGKFSYPLPSQPSGTNVIVYVKNEEKGLESEHISVPVNRTGPNQPTVNPISNKSASITGMINDSDATIIAMIDDKVYVSDQGAKALYELNTEIYDPKKKIVEMHIGISDTGIFTIQLPPQEANKTVTIYNLDHISRNSRVVTLKVSDDGPNAPVVYEVSNIEKSLNGYIPAITANVTYDISMVIGDKTYNVTADRDGRFTFDFNDQLHKGQRIMITASDRKNDIVRNSYTNEVIVKDIEDYVEADTEDFTLNKLTSKSDYITGSCPEEGTIYLAIATGEGEKFTNSLYTIDTSSDAKFSYRLENQLESGTTIYVMLRFTDGRILQVSKTVVIPGMPDIPSLLKKITNADKMVQVISDKDSEVLLTIGSKEYSTSDYVKDPVTGKFIYTIIIDRTKSGETVKLKATNVSGTSDILSTKIVKAAPDQPKVNKVRAGSTLITGKVELLDYTDPDSSVNTATEKTPEEFKNAPALVAKTQTRIFAKIGKKTYVGSIDSKGNYRIKIPKQKAGTVIYIWGSNKAGRGPLLKVTVVK